MPKWLALLVSVAVAIAALVILVLAASAALVLLPILALVALVTGWWMRRKIGRAGGQWPPQSAPETRNPDVIDADYVVIEPPRETPQSQRKPGQDAG